MTHKRIGPAILVLLSGLAASTATAQDDASVVRKQQGDPTGAAISPGQVEQEKAARAAAAAAAAAQQQIRTRAQPTTGTQTTPAGAAGTQGGAVRIPTPGTPAQPIRVEGEAPEVGPDEVALSDFSDALDLKTLVEFVAESLQINISASDQLAGQVVLNGPLVIKKADLIKFLDALLEQHGYFIVKDETINWYKISQDANVAFDLTATTRVIPTPGIRPSSLADAINAQLGVQNRQQRLTYLDDLGVIVVTETPRKIDSLVALVKSVLDRAADQQFIRFELNHIAASVARARVLELLGQSGGNSPIPGAPVVPGAAPGAGGSSGSLANLAERLTADAQGNALIFRGYGEEAEHVQDVLDVIDKPNTLEYKQYFAGTLALQIAQLAERFGFGTVQEIDSSSSSSTSVNQPFGQPFGQQGNNRNQQNFANVAAQQLGGGGGATSTGGPVMIVDANRGSIIYYGTATQQRQLGALIKVFDTEQDIVVIRTYKVKNQDATQVAEVLQNLLTQETGSDNSNPFFPGGGGFFNQFRNQFNQNQNQNQNNNNRTGTNRTGTTGTQRNTQGTNQRNQQGPIGFSGRGLPVGDGQGSLSGEDVFVVADPANNQVIVRASAKQQDEIAKLLTRLDQRRPQVFIEVQIVSVTATDDFRLAFETQLINANGTGGALNTNFGLGSLTTTSGTTTSGGFLSQKNVATGLGGLTAAIIKSDYVPITINALKRDADTRILSSPRLLVDDNQLAEIASTDEQPTSSTNQGTATTTTSFTGFESAGTTLSVTPSISDGGYLRLSYDIELSNFVGTGANGFPPPRQTRRLNSESVTIPGDSTIVVGGIEVSSKGNTTLKVPLIGDIPLLGYLFRDTNKNNSSTRLYVFITPRIMRDPGFRDLNLLTRGPAIEAGIAPDVPELEPVMVEIAGPYTPAPVTPGSPTSTPGGEQR
ncbi:MAG: type II secretion system protein GspD [Phycisphaerales bacterium]